MFRTIASLAFAGLALMPFAEKAEIAAIQSPPVVDSVKTGSLVGSNRHVFEAEAPSGARCRIAVDDALRASAGQAEADCAALLPGLEAMTLWVPQGTGTVRLVDNAGRTIAEVGASDGFAFEAVSPSIARFVLSDLNG